MRMVGNLAKLGLIALLAVLLSVLMAADTWQGGAPLDCDNSQDEDDIGCTGRFAVSMLTDWAFAVVALGALLAMAMAGAAYLVRDERLVNLMWEIGGEEE